MNSRKKLLKNKFNNIIINYIIYYNIISKKKYNYILKITIYIKLIIIDK